MRNIDELIATIIPPNDYQHRNGFSCVPVIASLSDDERPLVEQKLLEMLEKSSDTLIGEALVSLGCTDAAGLFYRKISTETTPMQKIIWASYINQLKGYDDELKTLVLQEFDKVSDTYSILPAFHLLARFGDADIDDRIRQYTDSKEYLIAYNARKALDLRN